MNIEKFNSLILEKINSQNKEKLNFENHIKEIQNEEKQLLNKLQCQHEIIEGSYRDYYDRVFTFYCKKCDYKMEF